MYVIYEEHEEKDYEYTRYFELVAVTGDEEKTKDEVKRLDSKHRKARYDYTYEWVDIL